MQNKETAQERTIGETIRFYRQKEGLTQDALAAKLLVSPQAVSKWENGQTAPDIALLLPLSRVLRVSVNEILGGDRRSELEREWQRAAPFGEELTLLISEEALKEFPDDETFLYRRACDEYHLGIREGLITAKREKYLFDAMLHFDALREKDPSYDIYTAMLADVQFARGLKDNALSLAYEIKDEKKRERKVAEYLGGDEEKRYKQKNLKKQAMDLFYQLKNNGTRASIDAAHGLLKVLFGDAEVLRAQYLSRLYITDACLTLDEGDVDGYVEKFTKAYEAVRLVDAEVRKPIVYPALFDCLDEKHARLQIHEFLREVLSKKKLHHPSSLALRQRIADDCLECHRLWRHEWIAFYQFCYDHLSSANYLNFGIQYSVTAKEEEEIREAFLDRYAPKRSQEALVAYYKSEIERLVGGGKMQGFCAYAMNDIAGYCNCGDKATYARLPIPEEHRAVKDGERVFAFAGILLADAFKGCRLEERLIAAALDYAKGEGYTHAEAYLCDRFAFPEDSVLFDQLLVTYVRQGFEIAVDYSEGQKRQYILRKAL